MWQMVLIERILTVYESRKNDPEDRCRVRDPLTIW